MSKNPKLLKIYGGGTDETGDKYCGGFCYTINYLAEVVLEACGSNIEPIHVGWETSRERLILEVWTNDTISPIDAVSRGANILVEQLSPFVNYVKISEMKAEEDLVHPAIPEEQGEVTDRRD